jgi:hypothetical protein
MVFDTFPLNCSFILPLANAPVAVPAEVGVERTWRTPTHESDKEQLLQRHARRSTRIRKGSYPHFFQIAKYNGQCRLQLAHRERRPTEGLKQKQTLSHLLSTETAGQSTDFFKCPGQAAANGLRSNALCRATSKPIIAYALIMGG